MNHFHNSRKPPTAEELNDFLEKAGQVDEEFLAFFRDRNGGCPDRNHLSLEGENLEFECLYPLTNDIVPNLFQELPQSASKPASKTSNQVIVIGQFSTGDALQVNLISGDISILLRGKRHELQIGISEFFDKQLKETSDDNTTNAHDTDDISEIGYRGDPKQLKQFVSNGGNINQPSVGGNTLIEIAALQRDYKFIQECLQYNADTRNVKRTLEQIADFDAIDELEKRWPQISW